MRRILVVEDSLTQAEQLRVILEEEGFDVTMARDAGQALDVFAASLFDLIVTDIVMPGMSGYDLCRRIKADPVKGRTPVIVLTRLADPLDILRGLACGADNYLTKPYPPETLLGRIQYIFANQARRAAGPPTAGVEVSVGGKAFTVTSDKGQIVDVLIAACEDVVRANEELRARQAELVEARAETEHRNVQLLQARDELERRVAERTAELERANAALRQEAEDRRRAEEDVNVARQAAERGLAHLRAVMSNMTDGLVIADAQGNLLDWNPAALRMHGYASVEEVRRHVSEFTATFVLSRPGGPPLPCSEWPMSRTLRGEAVEEEELHVRRIDTGQDWILRCNGAPVVGPDGAIVLAVLTLHDITERRRVEAEQRQTAELLRAVADGTTDAVFVKDRQGRYLLFNEAAARFVGKPVADVLGKDDTELFDLDGARLVMERDRRVMKTGLAETEEEVLTAAGVTRTYLSMKAPHRDGQDAIIGTIGISRDITDRKASEIALRDSEVRYRSLFERNLAGVMLTRRDGVILGANQAAARIFGLGSSGELTARRMPELYFDPAERDALAEAVAGDRVVTTREVRFRRADGRPVWTLANISVLHDGPEGPVYESTLFDITDRKRAEAERDEALARLRLQLERMPLAYLLFDADFCVIDWNPAAERTLGYSKEEALGKRPNDFNPPSFHAEADRLMERIRAGDMAAHSVNENVTKDGHTITCQWFNTPLFTDDGGFAGLLCLGRDVTEQKSLEAQLQQAQKMEAVGQLAGGVAHDFNNLIQVITGYGEMLLGSLRPDDPSRELVAEMTRAGERAAGLTRQLLAFSRRSVLALRVVDLNAVVIDLEKMLGRVIGEDVDLATRLQPGLGLVKADPGQMEQVVMNLAVNARDAMPRGGKLTIETRDAVLDDEYARLHAGVRPGPCVLLAVSDTGHGMTPEVQARIFEPFFTTKEKGKGTGLGLATVFGIVQQAGGHVMVYSEPGVGTSFKVYLPRVEESAAASRAQASAQPAPTGSETVLLVEDEDAVRALTRIVLQGAGYHVLEASDGGEAVAVANRYGGPIHLLLSDVVMPVLGGRELAEQLLAQHPGMKVLFQSGYTDDAVVRHGVLQEKVHFLQKPFTPAALARKVREVLDAPA